MFDVVKQTPHLTDFMTTKPPPHLNNSLVNCTQHNVSTDKINDVSRVDN